MIIVEGMDNSGKTTLISRLTKDLGLKVVKSPTPLDMAFEDAQVWLAEQLQNNEPLTIYDRFHPISEVVYGPILRGVHHYPVVQWVEIMYKLNRCRPTIIYCRPSTATILDWKERDQLTGVMDRAPALIEAYDHIFTTVIKNLCMLTFHYDYVEDYYKEVLAYVTRHIDWRKARGEC